MRLRRARARESASDATVALPKPRILSASLWPASRIHYHRLRTTNGKQRAGRTVGGGCRQLLGGEGGTVEAPGCHGVIVRRAVPRRLPPCLHEEQSALNAISLSSAPSDGAALRSSCRCAKHAPRAVCLSEQRLCRLLGYWLGQSRWRGTEAAGQSRWGGGGLWAAGLVSLGTNGC